MLYEGFKIWECVCGNIWDDDLCAIEVSPCPECNARGLRCINANVTNTSFPIFDGLDYWTHTQLQLALKWVNKHTVEKEKKELEEFRKKEIKNA